MNKVDIENLLRDFIIGQIVHFQNADPPPSNDTLLQESMADSLFIIDLILFIEKTFKVQFGAQELTMADLGSFPRVVDLVWKKTKSDPC